MAEPGFVKLLGLLLPEVIVVVAALAALAADLAWMRAVPRRVRMHAVAAIGSFGCMVAVAFLLQGGADLRCYDGMLALDPLSRLLKVVLLGLAAGTLWLSIEGEFTDHAGEYGSLVLMATVGAMFLVSTENLLMLFVALELLSLCLYVLTAFNRRSPKSAEAALKYFLFGGVSAGCLLFGLSLVYGLTGELNMTSIGAKLGANAPGTLDGLLGVALVMTLVGLGFKIAAAPFHLWAPDAYEGAPAPSAALIASASKVASFYVLLKVLVVGLAGAAGSGGWGEVRPGWAALVAGLSGVSLVVGNLAALAQTNVRRLVAYSAIAHAGYALVGVLAEREAAVASVLYYTVTYSMTSLGVFGVAAAVEREFPEGRVSDYAGLGRRSPVLAICLTLFLLSLAGIPPLAGFFGKFYVFAAALKADPNHLGLLWLVLLAIAMSVVSLYYYLQVLKQVYVVEPDLAGGSPPRLRPVALESLVVLVSLAAGVVGLGCFPQVLLGPIEAGIRALQW